MSDVIGILTISESLIKLYYKEISQNELYSISGPISFGA